jgi:pseudouridine synthase
MTLDRLLSRYGAASRSTAREMIKAGRVRVNGSIERNPERWVNRGSDNLQLDGRRLRPERKIYVLFYKPKGVIVSHGDPSGRTTIYDYLGGALSKEALPHAVARSAKVGRSSDGARAPATARTSGSGERQPKAAPRRRGDEAGPAMAPGGWLSPVGRLDKDTSGLLLVTNDTEFAHFVTNPQSNVPKTYLVKASGLMDDQILASLAGGVRMKRGDEACPISVRRLEDRGKYTWLEVVLTEGKNREVRRMIEAVGFKVLKLVRTAIGPLTLAGLEVGKWRTLSSAEIASLKNRGRGSRESGLGVTRRACDREG